MYNFPARIFLVSFLITCFANASFGQVNQNEPYSRYGFGALVPNYFGLSRGMGGVSAAIREDNTLNIANPASYSSIHITTLETGFSVNFLSLRAQLREKSVDANYSYLALGLPLSPKWAMTLAVLPYSNVGYTQSLGGRDPLLGPTISKYTGEGGLSEALMGHGFVIAKGLSLGFNVGYIFGSINTGQALEFKNAFGPSSDSAYNSRTTNTYQLGGFNYEYGIQYRYNLRKDESITIGYNGSYGNEILTRQKQYIERYSSNSRGNEQVLDTIFNLQLPQSYSYLPTKNAIGIAYKFRNKLLIAGDFNYDYYDRVVFNGLKVSNYNNSFRGALGVQYTPDITSVSNYLSLWDYRAGIYYGKTGLRVNQQDIEKYGVTFGFGVPLRPYTQTQLGAKMNFGFEIGRQGSVTSNNVLEKYFNVNVGFVLNQLWFYRYRYQ